MEKGGLGQVLALLGLVLLLLTGVGRQRARRQERQPSPSLQRWQQWGSLAGLALVLVGLLLMGTATK
jgi:uncharacterized membrane protein YidH (DUF202 family)